jgi:hypothetical protein
MTQPWPTRGCCAVGKKYSKELNGRKHLEDLSVKRVIITNNILGEIECGEVV